MSISQPHHIKPVYGFRYIQFEENSFNRMVYSHLEKYIDRNSEGELVCKGSYNPKFRIRFDGRTFNIMGLIWWLLNDEPAEGHIRSFSDNPMSVDPRYLYNPGQGMCL